jgi:hypothetical protein
VDWVDNGLVFATSVGTQPLADNVRRAFRRVIKAAGLDETAWTPRELRHSFGSRCAECPLMPRTVMFETP